MKKKISREAFARITLLSISALIIVATLIGGQIIKQNSAYNNQSTNDYKGFDIADLGKGNADGVSENNDIIPENTNKAADADVSNYTPDNTQQSVPDETASVGDLLIAASGTVDFSKLVWPVTSTDIVMDFSYNKDPVYSKTFKEYRSDHTGVDISASVGENVKCVYDGKVIAIKDDEKLGTLVQVDHGNNIITEYANLQKNVAVTLNQNIKAGANIGKVGETAAYESEEASHLHFGLLLDGKYVDIKEYMKF